MTTLSAAHWLVQLYNYYSHTGRIFTKVWQQSSFYILAHFTIWKKLSTKIELVLLPQYISQQFLLIEYRMQQTKKTEKQVHLI